MGQNFSTFAFTDSVKNAQTHYGSRNNYAGLEQEPDRFTLTDKEIAFIESRDSFYMSTVGENGWPYMQFRGGPIGFFKVIGERAIGFADFRGNRQYISTGNLNAEKKAMLFLIDYPTRQRVKIWTSCEIKDVDDDPELAAQLISPDYRAKVERLFVFTIEAFDWNCPQHITKRYSLDEIKEQLRRGNPSFLDLIPTD
ncbi:MAG: putative pyridoxine 5'-phosphate oxidase superfamily flavin-nucleotide-binding protein [Pseudoalteromonas tetraodonis]|jgi:predicted pyridoxine 5'-phosphate oxidase superfamily flavin-nucleotide-binding protein